MRILVTGGTGFIGSNVVEALLARGDDVLITGHDAEQKPKGFLGKVLQPSFLGLDWDAIGKIDALVHEAAINDTTLMDEHEMLRANVDSSIQLFEHVVANGCKRIVYASSTAVYGDGPVPYQESQKLNPLNPYAVSKQKLEEAAAEISKAHSDLTVVGLRYCNVYGPGESHKGKRASMILQLAEQMKKGNPKLFKSGEQKRDYIYVKDVVTANLRALEASESCIVNCGSGSATTFNDLVTILNETLRASRTPQYIENPHEGKYQSFTQCDMSLAKEKLGFVPEYSVSDGIKDYAKNGLV